MSEFEEWFTNQFPRGDGDDKHIAKMAWNAALDEVSEALEIHDTLGDIKYEVNKRLKESYD